MIESTPIVSPSDGVIIDMVVPTVVYTGDRMFHSAYEKIAEIELI